jgi:hypothetical protein
MNEYKQELFEKAGVGIPHEDIESNDVCIFGYNKLRVVSAVTRLGELVFLWPFC